MFWKFCDICDLPANHNRIESLPNFLCTNDGNDIWILSIQQTLDIFYALCRSHSLSHLCILHAYFTRKANAQSRNFMIHPQHILCLLKCCKLTNITIYRCIYVGWMLDVCMCTPLSPCHIHWNWCCKSDLSFKAYVYDIKLDENVQKK